MADMSVFYVSDLQLREIKRVFDYFYGLKAFDVADAVALTRLAFDLHRPPVTPEEAVALLKALREFENKQKETPPAEEEESHAG